MVIGYIGAGMIIGPYTPPFSFLTQPEILNLFAEMGIVLLLFVVGLEYPVARFRLIGRKALVIALSEAFGTFALGSLVGQAMGLQLFDSLFLALAISVTSTVLVMRVLEELKLLDDEASRLLLGVAVIEDIIIIASLAVLQSAASTGSLAAQEVAESTGIVLIFVIGTLYIGSRIVPKFVDLIARTRHDELVVVVILGVAFSLSFIANQIGISVATGAFFAGVLVAESKTHSVAKTLATPLKDMFAALFFVSVGALMDIRLLPLFLAPAIVLIATSFAAKFATVYFSAKVQGFSKKTSMKAGFGLSASGGELALVTAKGGVDIGATSSFILPMVGAMTIITTFLSPYIIKMGWKLASPTAQSQDQNQDQHSN